MVDVLFWILLCIIVVLVWISVYDTSRFTVSEYEFTSKKIKKPLKAVFLSDLHCKMYGYEGTFLLEKIREISPDLILCGGDMITAYPGAKTARVEAFLGELKKDFPIVYAFGNHELRLKIYPDTYGDQWENYTKSLKELGVEITENGTYAVEEAGVNVICYSADREFYKRSKKTVLDPSDIQNSVGFPNKKAFNILLAHNPDHFEAYTAYGADLTLSGHLHGGVVRIPVFPGKKAREEGAHTTRGLISPRLIFFPKYDAGRFDKDDRTMIVSRGLGMHTFPIRILNPGELMVIDLKASGGV